MLSTKPVVDWAVDSQARAEGVAARFRERFASEPELWARAPGRVDLMGSHTDYNLGFVLTLPISRDTWIAARRRNDGIVRVYSMNLDAEDEFRVDAIDSISEPKWCNYVRSVAATLQDEGLALTGYNAMIHSTVPVEAGLSSSAALECALATVFAGLGGWSLTPERKALLCQKAENEFVGVKCGILDQYSSCLGRAGCALLLDCRDLSTRAVWIADGIRVVACNTMSQRRLSGGEYAQRRAECEQGAAVLGVSALRDMTPEMLAARRHELPERVARRCEFIVAESARAESLAQALIAGDRPAVARLCAKSFAGARDLYEICSPAMVTMMDAMLAAPGVIGARQAGAGFGGCMVALVDAACTDAFRAAVLAAYHSATQVLPEIYPVGAAPGAEVFDREKIGK
ncbi:MAG: galactokinase [Bryobacteraceae bacterium]|jgi:galactokinase